MARKHLPPNGLDLSLAHAESDLDILDKHADRLSAVEHDIQAEMKRTDREYRDSHFHSIPKPIKHVNGRG